MTELGEETYYDHAKYKSWWWKEKYFTGDLEYFWPPELDETEVDKDGYRLLSRNAVFKIAATETEHRELHTAVAAYVWGVGVKSLHTIGWRAKAFTANGTTVETNLKLAASILTSEGAVAAYQSMLTGPARTLHMGPGYFTKFLFFMGYRDPSVPGLRPLILDSRVAEALMHREVFAPKAGSSGWPSNLYERYLTYCQAENPEEPEAVEVELFNAGGR